MFRKRRQSNQRPAPKPSLILEPIWTPSGIIPGIDDSDPIPEVIDSGPIDPNILDFDTLDFATGTFTVGADGEVGIDFLFDGGGYDQGEVGIFSLEGLEGEMTQEEFIQEAARRVLSSTDGHVIIQDATEGARFSGVTYGEPDFNSGDYRQVQTYQMEAGTKFGVMLMPNQSFQDLADGNAAYEPLFSMATLNPDDQFQFGQIADLTGDGNTFAFEDLTLAGQSDRDYNDIVFQVRGATGDAELMDDWVDENHEWRETNLGQALVEYASAYTEEVDFTPVEFAEPVEQQPLVGIIDTGFAADNPDLDYDNITTGSDFVDGDRDPFLAAGEGNEHGTHVLGIIAAQQDNGVGIDGINDDAPIWLGRAVGSGRWADSLIEFVDAAAESGQPNAVVNLSFDFTEVDADGNATTRYALTEAERAALLYAQQNGVLIIAGAGNEGEQMSALGQASLEFDNIITVGSAQRVNDSTSVWEAFERADYSSYGYGLDLMADGGMPWDPQFSTIGDDIGAMVGTSVSTAKVTGAASQVWAANPDLNYQQVRDILKRTATELGDHNWDVETGMGMLNIGAAIDLAKATEGKPYIPKGFDQLQQWLWNAQIPQVFWPGFYRTYYYFDTQSKIQGEVWNPVGDSWAGERPVFFGAIGNAIGGAVDSVSNAVSNVVDNVSNAVSNVVDSVSNTVSNVVNTVTNTVSNVVNNVTNTVSNAVNNVSNTVSNAWSNTSNWVGNAWNTVTNVVSTVVDPVTQLVNEAYSNINAGIESLTSGALELGSAAYNQVVGFVDDTWSNVEDIAANVWGTGSEWMTDPVENIMSWAGDAWDGGIEWSGNAWDTAQDWFADPGSWASGVWEGAGSQVSQFQNAAGDWWSDSLDSMGGAFGGAGNFLSDQGSALNDWWQDTAPDWGELDGQAKELFEGIANNVGKAAGGFADTLGNMTPNSLSLMTANPALALVTNPIEAAQTTSNLYKTFSAVSHDPDLLWKELGTPHDWWDASIDAVGDAWNDTTEVLGDAWSVSSQWVSDQYDSFSNWGHGILDVAGLVPAFGAIPDGINAVWYALEGIAGKEGAWEGFAWSAFAFIPLIGIGGTLAKWGKKFKWVDEVMGGVSSAGKWTGGLVDNVVKWFDDTAGGIKKWIPEDKIDDVVDSGGNAAKGVDNIPIKNLPTGNPNKLGRNLESLGQKRPEGAAAHHIVQGGSEKTDAVQARRKLYSLGIDIDDPANGVWLPTEKSPSSVPGINHRKIHTNTYREQVARDLQSATTKEEAIEILEDIKQRILDEDFPY